MEKFRNLGIRGKEYNPIAIFGTQSGGKTTLINKLCNTELRVMKESDKGQTTKGIWVAVDQERKLIVFDIEGSDSNERNELEKTANENSINFQDKAAYFGIAVANIFILNITNPKV